MCSSAVYLSRHINIRYFFVQDRIGSGEIKVEYCPTAEMLADYFTKPLQGVLFRKFRDEIMNNVSDPDSKSSQDHRSVLEHTDNNFQVDPDVNNQDETGKHGKDNPDTYEEGEPWITVTRMNIGRKGKQKLPSVKTSRVASDKSPMDSEAKIGQK